MAKVNWGFLKGRRGILFTMSVLLLAISLVGLAISLSQQSSQGKYAAVAVLEIDRVSDVHDNIQDQLVRILAATADISASGNYAIFNESLPYDPEFAADVGRFASFEAGYSDLNVSMDLASLKAGSFIVQPNNISVTHPSGSFLAIPQNSTLSSGAVSSYDVNITFPVQSVNGAAWVSLVTVPPGSADAETVHVRVQDASYSFVQDYYYTLNKSSTSLLNMTQGSGLVGTVLFFPKAALQVNYTGNIGLKASIGLTNQVYIGTNDTITVVASANDTGRLRIA